MLLSDKLLSICKSGNRIVPKRNAAWVANNHPDIFKEMKLAFPNGESVRDIINYSKYNIHNYDEIPKCSVCENKVHLLGDKLLTECSISCSQKSEKVKSKIDKTCIEKYGSIRYFGERKKPELGEHYLQKSLTNLEFIHDNEFMESLKIKPWKEIAAFFGFSTNSHSSVFRFMKKIGYEIPSMNGKSHEEIEVIEYVKSLGAIAYSTKGIIPPYELDIYIPEKNLAIEYDGLYWHSSGSRETDKEFNFKHISKTEMCEAQGIQLLHIFENEWLDETKREIWKSVIKHKLGLSKRIYARKCELRELKSKEYNKFLEDNHLQGKCSGTKIAFGLYYNNELVQVATFGKPRYNNGYKWELLRLCSKRGICVVGGASKLINMIKEPIISYGNRRWCSTLSNVYDKILSSTNKTSAPCYYYIQCDKLYHRSSFMKHKLKDKLKTYDDKMTEVENCYNNGLRRIWDCGNLVYIKK